MGLSQAIEVEGHDRRAGYKCDNEQQSEVLGLPGKIHLGIFMAFLGCQLKLVQEISKLRKPIVLVLLNGGPVSVNWKEQNIPAILNTFYSGAISGQTIAQVLFGKYNPGNKLDNE